MAQSTTSVTDTALDIFLGLAAGSIDTVVGGNAVNGSGFQQTFAATAGEILGFQRNFVTAEPTLPSPLVNDTAFVAINGVLTELADTGSVFFPAEPPFDQTGYGQFSFVAPVTGMLTLGFGWLTSPITWARCVFRLPQRERSVAPAGALRACHAALCENPDHRTLTDLEVRLL